MAFGSMKIDFEEAKRIVLAMQQEVVKINDNVRIVNETLKSTQETNNQANLGRVAGGFLALAPQVESGVDIAGALVKAVSDYEDAYNADVDNAQLDAGIWDN